MNYFLSLPRSRHSPILAVPGALVGSGPTELRMVRLGEGVEQEEGRVVRQGPSYEIQSKVRHGPRQVDQLERLLDD